MKMAESLHVIFPQLDKKLIDDVLKRCSGNGKIRHTHTYAYTCAPTLLMLGYASNEVVSYLYF